MGEDYSLSYSAPKIEGVKRFEDIRSDWFCVKCNGHNFKKRDVCYKCSAPRMDSCSLSSDGSELIGSSPCNTLILRDLDALSTEDSISVVLTRLCADPLKNVTVLRDVLTNVSKCCAMVELASVTEAMQLLDAIQKLQLLEIDGKVVQVDYAKNTYKTILANFQAQSDAIVANRNEATVKSLTHQLLPQDSAALQQLTQLQQAQQLLASQQLIGGPIALGLPLSTASPTLATLTTVSNPLLQLQQALAASHRNASLLQAQQALLLRHQAAAVSTDVTATSSSSSAAIIEAKPQVSQVRPTLTIELGQPVKPPETSKFIKEETSGYFYDPETGFYYHPDTQYFYDSTRSKYLFWDSEGCCYRDSADLPKIQEKKAASVSGKKKSNNASNIQKNMEKWAKQVNKQQKPKGPNLNNSGGYSSNQQSMREDSIWSNDDSNDSKTADTVYNMLCAKATASSTILPTPAAAIAASSAVVEQSTKPASGSIEEEEEKLLDWNRLACLLCQRGFNDADTLKKHRELSQLHKSNLDNLKEKLGLVADYQYRDRAMERRMKYGPATSPPRPKQRSAGANNNVFGESSSTYSTTPLDVEQPQNSLGVGKKLLQKMGGWQEGQGLGREGQGRTDIVQPEFRTPGVGLGASGSRRDTPDPNATYKDNVKKAMFARFHELGN